MLKNTILIIVIFSSSLFAQSPYNGTHLGDWLDECKSKQANMKYETSQENGVTCFHNVSCVGSNKDVWDIKLKQKLDQCHNTADVIDAVNQIKNNAGNPQVTEYEIANCPHSKQNGKYVPGDCGSKVYDAGNGIYASTEICKSECSAYHRRQRKGKKTRKRHQRKCFNCLTDYQTTQCMMNGANSKACLQGKYQITDGNPSRIILDGSSSCAVGAQGCFDQEGQRRRYENQNDQDCPECKAHNKKKKGGFWNFMSTVAGVGLGVALPAWFNHKTMKSFADACPTAYDSYIQGYENLNDNTLQENIRRANNNEPPVEFTSPRSPNCNGSSFGQFAGLGSGIGGLNNGLYGRGYQGYNQGVQGVNPYGGMGAMFNLNLGGGLPGVFNHNNGWQNGGYYQGGSPWQAGYNGHVPGYAGGRYPYGNNGGSIGGAIGSSYLLGGAIGGIGGRGGFNGYGQGGGNINGFGNGYGNGFGNGYGNGFGNGYGNGLGNGYGNGFGNGYGNNGYGNGNLNNGATRGGIGRSSGYFNPQQTYYQYNKQQAALGRDAQSYGQRAYSQGWGANYAGPQFGPF